MKEMSANVGVTQVNDQPQECKAEVADCCAPFSEVAAVLGLQQGDEQPEPVDGININYKHDQLAPRAAMVGACVRPAPSDLEEATGELQVEQSLIGQLMGKVRDLKNKGSAQGPANDEILEKSKKGVERLREELEDAKRNRDGQQPTNDETLEELKREIERLRKELECGKKNEDGEQESNDEALEISKKEIEHLRKELEDVKKNIDGPAKDNEQLDKANEEIARLYQEVQNLKNNATAPIDNRALEATQGENRELREKLAATLSREENSTRILAANAAIKT
jgi:chromosome segregation ATPase